MRPRTHTSAALAQLRGWVTLLSGIICICALTQALVFAFANYTTVRTTELKPDARQRSLEVVNTDPQSSQLAGLRERVSSGAESGAKSDTTPNPNTARTPADLMMSRASAIAAGVGSLSCFALCALTLLGVIVGAGASVPGIEKCVTAGVWSIALSLMCVPWADALPSLRIPGMFANYTLMTAAIDGVPGAMVSAAGMYVQWLAMPLVAAIVSVGVCVWFRTGVDRGVIISAPSQLDRAIEREAAELSKQGVASGVSRSVGALNQAIGDVPASGRPASGPSLEQAIDLAAGTAHTLTSDISPSLTASGGGRGVADSGYKRLI